MMLTPKNNWVCLDCSYREDAGNETSTPKQKKSEQLSSVTDVGMKKNKDHAPSDQKVRESKIDQLNMQYADDLASGKEEKRRGNFQAEKEVPTTSKPKQPEEKVAQHETVIPSEVKLKLDQRLAEGEIKLTDYKEMRNAIEDTSTPVPEPTQQTSYKNRRKYEFWNYLGWLGLPILIPITIYVTFIADVGEAPTIFKDPWLLGLVAFMGFCMIMRKSYSDD